MKINRNMSAVIANNQLRRTENRLQKSMERLSSGLKLNSPQDNPAGMAISNKMKAQIDGLGKADDNSKDGISVAQIADGALNEVHSIIQRMRELSVQAANGTNTYDDRQSIQTEIDQLRQEVDRISADTEYNTKKLLDGSSDMRVYSKEASRINISDRVPADIYEISVEANATQAEVSFNVPATFSADGTVSVNDIKVTVTAGMTEAEFLNALDKAASEAGAEKKVNDDGTISLFSKYYGSDADIKWTFSESLDGDFSTVGMTYDAEKKEYSATENGVDAIAKLGANFTENATMETVGNRVYIRDSSGFTMDFLLNDGLLNEEDENGDPITEKIVSVDVTNIGSMTIQIGSNQYQEMDIRIPEISVETLYLDEIDVSIKGGGQRALDILDDALAKTSLVRSSLGAFQNRLEYASNSLAETEENMTSAYSLITDTDMAEEMTEYAQQNILDQAGISVLAQANDLPQQVLSLLSR